MPYIKVMSEHLSNKIAAGEVVERPASVVKELVENAIDAKSTRIEVHVQEGGLEKIKVIDNGQGMDRVDAQLAFERHATSKLKADRDLFHISTLGFRGEALPSIAAVAHMCLETWNGEEEAGTRIRIEGGKMKETTAAPLRKGTMIEVTDLFYNTPARYKYLKTIHTELSHISDYMNRLALAHPSISLKLIHNGRELLSTNGKGQPVQVLAHIYGQSVARQMIPLQRTHIDFELEAYLGKPEITRSNRSYISLIVNGRYIKNYAVHQAVLKAYHTLLPINRYPIVLISLEMDPSLVDINVHPAKLEARISKEKELVDWLIECMREALQNHPFIPRPYESGFKDKKEQQPTEEQQRFHIQEQMDLRLPSERNLQDNAQAQGSQHIQSGNEKQEDHPAQEDQHMQGGQYLQDVPDGCEDSSNPSQLREPIQALDQASTQKREVNESERGAQIPLLSPMGQLHGTYILAQNEDGLYMIDQHAAQERIWYEHFYQRLNNPPRENQELLVPIVLAFSAGEFEMIQENLPLLEEAGLFLEEFGHHSYMIRSHPQWFPEGEEEALIRDMIDYVIKKKGNIEWIPFREKVAIMMSCKQAIKANRYLTMPEMEALLEKLRQSSNPYTCPHGRPITVLLTTYDIEKMFKRVM